MFYHTQYGIRFKSPFSLPELNTSAEKKYEVDIRLEKLNQHSLTNYRDGCAALVSEREAYFRWDEVGTFLVRNGDEIVIDPFPGVDEALIRLAVSSAVLGMLLHQRGFVVLHASAIVVDETAIVFLGDKGWGKSTLVASFNEMGYQVITDDMLVLGMDNNRSGNLIAFPGIPRMKLWPDTITALGKDPQKFPRLHSETEKREYGQEISFAETPFPLRAVYVLGIMKELDASFFTNQEAMPRKKHYRSTDECQLNRLNLKTVLPSQAFRAFIEHTYGIRFHRQNTEFNKKNFFRCVKFAKQIPMYRFERPLSFNLWSDLKILLEKHLKNRD